MTTSLDYDQVEGKFGNKETVISLVFANDNQVIGTHKLDIGQSTNKFGGKTVKFTLDLKSDKYTGS